MAHVSYPIARVTAKSQSLPSCHAEMPRKSGCFQEPCAHLTHQRLQGLLQCQCAAHPPEKRSLRDVLWDKAATVAPTNKHTLSRESSRCTSLKTRRNKEAGGMATPDLLQIARKRVSLSGTFRNWKSHPRNPAGSIIFNKISDGLLYLLLWRDTLVLNKREYEATNIMRVYGKKTDLIGKERDTLTQSWDITN